jgi:hypothetical protein
VSLLTGGDIKLDQLKGVQDALVAADARTAREYGFGAYGTKRVEPMAPRSTRAQPSAASTTPAAGDGMVTVRSRDGQTMRVDPQRAKRFQAMDPSIEIEGL